MANLDHLVVASETLEQGVEWINQRFGIDIPYGGEHPMMGTHNHIMRLGGEVYFEIIAINPNAAAPNRPRWFSLDDPMVRQQLSIEPRFLTWVVNVPDLRSALSSTPFPFGVAQPMSRGDLNWLFGIPEDGQLPAAGFLPTLIEWEVDPHPSGRMANLGCHLQTLTIFHPVANWLAQILQEIEADHLVTVEPIQPNEAPYMVAEIETPNGIVTLESSRL